MPGPPSLFQNPYPTGFRLCLPNLLQDFSDPFDILFRMTGDADIEDLSRMDDQRLPYGRLHADAQGARIHCQTTDRRPVGYKNRLPNIPQATISSRKKPLSQ